MASVVKKAAAGTPAAGTEDVKSIPVDSASIVSLQDEKHVGFKSMVDDILQVAERHPAKLNQRQRETCPASELVVGMQWRQRRRFSGVTANPAVGYAVRSAGALRRDGDVLRGDRSPRRHPSADPRAINEEVGKRLLEEMVRYDNYLDMGKTDRSANPSPATRKAAGQRGGKSAGSIANQGKSAIVEVLSPGSARPNAASFTPQPRQRFCLRHPAGGLWHHGAGIHHRSRYAVRTDGGTGDKNGDPYRAGQPLV